MNTELNIEKMIVKLMSNIFKELICIQNLLKKLLLMCTND